MPTITNVTDPKLRAQLFLDHYADYMPSREKKIKIKKKDGGVKLTIVKDDEDASE